MYKRILEQKNISHYYQIAGNKLITKTNSEGIRCVLLENFSEIWKFNDTYNFFTYDNKVFCGRLGNKSSTLISIENGNVIRDYGFDLNLPGILKNKYYYGNVRYKEIPSLLRFSFEKDNVDQITPVRFGTKVIYKEKYLIGSKYGNILLISEIGNIDSLWELDVKDLGLFNDWAGEHEGEVENIYEYGEHIIVLTGRTIASFEIKSGKLLWKVNVDGFEPNDMAIHNNFGYLNKGVYYAVVELDKGLLLLERKLDNFKFENHEFSPLGGLPVYNEGKLWSTIFSNGVPFIAALRPHTGDYEWIGRVPTSEFTNQPKFLNDKMFILDTGGTLHIYEKEQK